MKLFRVQKNCLRSSYGIEAENWLVTNDEYAIVLNNEAEANMVCNMANDMINNDFNNTENDSTNSRNEKRYKLSKPNGAYLIDDDKVYAHWINDDDKIIDLLNEQHEENEQLKQRNNRQAKQLDRLYNLIEEKD